MYYEWGGARVTRLRCLKHGDLRSPPAALCFCFLHLQKSALLPGSEHNTQQMKMTSEIYANTLMRREHLNINAFSMNINICLEKHRKEKRLRRLPPR